MKGFAGLIFSFVLCSNVVAQVAAPIPDFNEKLAASEMRSAQGLLSFHEDLATTNYNIVYDKCFWNIDPAVKFISGHVQTYFIPLNSGINSIVLDLTDSLTVDSIIYNNQKTIFSHIDSQVVTNFSSALTIGDEYNVDIYYHGVPPTVGFGSFVQQKHGPDSIPTVWTLSEPYGASDWWPCKNSLTDKIDSIDIYVTTPSQYRDGSNGILVSQDSSGGFTTWHWKHRFPIATYLVAIDVTSFYVNTEHVVYKGDSVNVLNYVWPEDTAAFFSEETPILGQSMLIYDSLYELYPFSKEKYGHAQFGWGDGGMEHQTMSYMANFGWELIVHELAHQWFGDKVTCGSWQDIFLNEGFAVYSTDICYQELSQNTWWPVWKNEELNKITSQPDGSVWVDDTTSVTRIFDSRLTYAKGGYLLHQLRYQIGDEAFFAGLYSYLDDPKLAFGFARVSDLTAHLSASSGIDLTDYFNKWYYGQGFPRYHINWSEGGNIVNLIVNQTTSDSASVSFFPLIIPVEFKNTTNDTIVRLTNSFSGQSYTIQLPFTVDSVKFDPEQTLISAGNTISKINQITTGQYEVNIFPNPVSTNLLINTSDNGYHLLSASLYNIVGERVYKQSFLQNANSTIIPTQTLADGVYMLNLSTDAGELQKKIIVIH